MARNWIPLVPSGTINADASVAQLEQDVLAMDSRVGELAEDVGTIEQWDAGDIPFDPDETYASGSIGKEMHTLDGDVSTLKSEIDEVADQKAVVVATEQGTIIQGNPSASTTRIRTAKIYIRSGSRITFAGGVKAERIAVEYYNAQGTFVREMQGWTTAWDYTATDDCYMVFVYSNSSTTDISPSDYDATTIITFPMQIQLDKNTSGIATADANIESIAEETGATVTDSFSRTHGTTINESASKIEISIPKNWNVTIYSDDSAEQTKTMSVYVHYKGDGSATLLPSNITIDGGSITFVAAKEVDWISFYQTSVVAGTLTITIARYLPKSLVGIPTYYQDHIVSKTADVRANMMGAGKDGETFVFITDIHWENNNRNSPVLVKYLLDNLNIHHLLCGGDLINEGTKDAMALAMIEGIKAFYFKNVFFPCAFGNHDSNKNGGNATLTERWFDDGEEYALMQKQAENFVTYFTDTGWNFYFDNPATKTRWIVCDTNENGSFANYDELATLLNSTPAGYHIIIGAHWFRDSGTNSTFTTNVSNMTDAYNSKSTVTIDEEAYDFSSATAEIVLIIGGHLHNDYDTETTDGIPIVLTDCDNGPRSDNTDYPYVKGTITEQAFDVVTLDYTNKTVKFVRIGRGADRTFTYGE